MGTQQPHKTGLIARWRARRRRKAVERYEAGPRSPRDISSVQGEAFRRGGVASGSGSIHPGGLGGP